MVQAADRRKADLAEMDGLKSMKGRSGRTVGVEEMVKGMKKCSKKKHRLWEVISQKDLSYCHLHTIIQCVIAWNLC